MSKPYNTTQLHPYRYMEKNVEHRDLLAHAFRWSHVLKLSKIGMKILDVGCGDGNLYETFYRNRYSPSRYLGLDIRKSTIEKNKVKFPKAEFLEQDLVKDFDLGKDWDIIASFETIEHIGKQNVSMLLKNIWKHCNEKTIVLLSTPCYDEKVGAAGNHTYDSGDGQGVASQELTFQELKTLIEERFTIDKVYGTFASQKDYKHLMNDWQQKMFEHLNEYYSSNYVSIMMAPFFPEQSRNCLWRLTMKS